MAKMTLSPRDELALAKSKIARLAAQKADIEQETERLKARVQELEAPIEKPEDPEDGKPSFMKLTLACRARAGAPQQQSTIPQEESPRRSGVAKTPGPSPLWDGWYGPRFARQTVSWSCRRSDKVHHRRPRPPPDLTWEPTPVEASTRNPNFDEEYSNHDMTLADSTESWVVERIQAAKRADAAERAYAAMSERTRLRDVYLSFKSLSSGVNVPGEVGFKLLQDGLELARQGFHEFCRQKVPNLWLYSYYMSPYSVVFGYSEMERDRVQHFISREDLSKEGLSNQKVQTALESLTSVRNTYCHFRSGEETQCRHLNWQLENVQELLLALGDEEKAMRARGLRDQLRQAADQAVAEMETIGLMSSLPFHDGLDWAPHHEQFFSRRRHGNDIPEGSAIHQAIEAWSARRYAPGKDWESGLAGG